MLGPLLEIRHEIPDALKHYRIALRFYPNYQAALKNLHRSVTVAGCQGPILLGELKQPG